MKELILRKTILGTLQNDSHLTKSKLFDLVKSVGTVQWDVFKRAIDNLVLDKSIKCIEPAYSNSLHDTYVLTDKGLKSLNFDVINIVTGEVLFENLTKQDALFHAAAYGDKNGCTSIEIDMWNMQVLVR